MFIAFNLSAPVSPLTSEPTFFMSLDSLRHHNHSLNEFGFFYTLCRTNSILPTNLKVKPAIYRPE